MKTIFRRCLAFALATALVGCGGGGGTDSGQQPPASNIAPAANAGPIQNVMTGTIVTLDGSGSDANGDTLTYNWSLVAPSGSTANLSQATTPKPTFVVDVAGTYFATLIVNDGKVNSAAATVTVTASAANAGPVANAGVAQNVLTGALLTLNGSSSSDANGDPLTYTWSLISRPPGSAVVLTRAVAVNPTFTPDVAGTYVASLVVNDGKASSSASTVMVTAMVGNATPIANAGVEQTVIIGTVVTLDGSASYDVNLDRLTFAWTLTSKPVGSASVLTADNAVNPSVTVDIAGTYVATLAVNDGKVSSAPATVMVTANTVQYVATEIELPPGAVGYAEGLNDKGQVVGSGYFPGGSSYGFYTGENGLGVQLLPTFGPYRINVNGLAIGRTIESGTTTPRGATFDTTTSQVTILSTLGGSDSSPSAISATGWIVGSSYPINSFVGLPVVWASGAAIPVLVGPQSSGSGMVDINSPGIAVGNPNSYSTNEQAFVVDANTGVWMRFGPVGARVTAINDLGQVLIGRFITDPTRTILTPLATLSGSNAVPAGLDLNSDGIVVGTVEVAPSVYHAFVTGQSGVGTYDLNAITTLPSGVTLYRAVGINARGQIAIQGPRNYLLTPTAP